MYYKSAHSIYNVKYLDEAVWFYRLQIHDVDS